MYGASRAGARRGVQREAESQQAMEYEVQQRMAAQQSRNDQEERRRDQEERRRNDAIDKEREQIRARLEQEERARMDARIAAQSTLAPPSYAGVAPNYAGIDTLFCAECGQQCRVVDKFCNGCGSRLPGLVEKGAPQ